MVPIYVKYYIKTALFINIELYRLLTKSYYYSTFAPPIIISIIKKELI